MAPVTVADSPRTIVNAANAAFTRLEASNPSVYLALSNAYLKAGFQNSAEVQSILNRVTNPTDRTALKKFFSSPAALGLAVKDALGGAVQGVGKVIGKGAGSTANLTQGVGSAVGAGLATNVEPLAGIAGVLSTLTSGNTWLRVGEGILGIVLIGIGLMAITKSTSVGKAAASTAGKAAKLL